MLITFRPNPNVNKAITVEITFIGHGYAGGKFLTYDWHVINKEQAAAYLNSEECRKEVEAHGYDYSRSRIIEDKEITSNPLFNAEWEESIRNNVRNFLYGTA